MNFLFLFQVYEMRLTFFTCIHFTIHSIMRVYCLVVLLLLIVHIIIL